jgi:hypothetical protein
MSCKSSINPITNQIMSIVTLSRDNILYTEALLRQFLILNFIVYLRFLLDKYETKLNFPNII